MADILHRVAIKDTTPEKVYGAIATIDGLAGWWTETTTGSTDTDGVIQFRFPPGGFDMKVTGQRPSEHVSWTVVDGPQEWIGTTIDWTLRQDGEWTVVLFSHSGWAEPVEFMHHCSTKWATYLMSLKSLVETGTGAPSPHDVHIADWD